MDNNIRIATLIRALRNMMDVGQEYYDMDMGPNGSEALKEARAALAMAGAGWWHCIRCDAYFPGDNKKCACEKSPSPWEPASEV